MVRQVLIDRGDAISTVFSFLLITLIITTTAGAVVLYGMPYINELNEKKEKETMRVQFSSLLDEIKGIVSEDQGVGKSIRFPVGEGSLNMDKNSFDRTIVTYSLDTEYSFYVTGLNDVVNSFNLVNLTDSYETKARIYQMDEGGSLLGDYDEDDALSDGISLPAGEFFEDKMVIYLLNSTDDVLGKIWLFDSNSLICSKSNENYNLIFEKAGFLSDQNGNVQMEQVSIIDEYENYFALRIYQTKAQDSVSRSGGNANIYFTNKGNVAQDIGTVYNLRLQFHGGYNNDTWIDYYSDFTNFVEDPAGNLFVSPSVDGIWFTLMHSIIEFNFS